MKHKLGVYKIVGKAKEKPLPSFRLRKEKYLKFRHISAGVLKLVQNLPVFCGDNKVIIVSLIKTGKFCTTFRTHLSLQSPSFVARSNLLTFLTYWPFGLHSMVLTDSFLNIRDLKLSISEQVFGAKILLTYL